MPLKEADKNYDFKKIEEKVQNFWADSDIYEKTNKLRANGPQYSFFIYTLCHRFSYIM